MEQISKSILDFLHFSRPTDEQESVLKAMEDFVKVENTQDFLILCGAAGTGKTSITSALINYLNYVKRQYKIAAPTGRAARILGRKANVTTATIHSLIYIPEPNRDTGNVAFKLKAGYNSKPAVYIIDEASMIPKDLSDSNSLFEAERGLIYDLVSYVKGANVNNKIIFLGDQYQLPPIGESQSCALDKQFLENAFNFTGSAYVLTEVKRQQDGSYILRNATETRIAIDEGKKSYPLTGKENVNIYKAAESYVLDSDSNGPQNSVAIGVSHKANNFFNSLVRDKIFGRAKKVLEIRDLLMVTQNWSRNGVQLYNGDHVEVLNVDWNIQEQVGGLHFVPVKVKLLFSDLETEIDDYAVIESIVSAGGVIDRKLENALRKERYVKNKIFRESNNPSDDRYVGALRLMYGHAITCNKAQGGEWNKVFINTLGIPSLKWQYTAITRGIRDIEKF